MKNSLLFLSILLYTNISLCSLSSNEELKIGYQKGYIDFEAAKLFWDNTKLYQQLTSSNPSLHSQPIRITWNNLKFLFKNNPSIHCSINKSDSPLSFFTRLAIGQSRHSEQRITLRNLVPFDSDNDRRLNVIKIAIQHYDAQIVSEMLFLGTDITKSPDLLEQIVTRCTSSSSSTTVYQKAQLLALTGSLLRANAPFQSTHGRTYNQHHLQSENCWCCHLICSNVPLPPKSLSSDKDREPDNKAADLLWRHINQYHDQAKRKKPTNLTLDTLAILLDRNHHLLSMCKSIPNGFNTYAKSTLPTKLYSPLEIAAIIALGKPLISQERTFFTNVAQLPFDNQQRLEVVLMGIHTASFPIVQVMLKTGANITRSSVIMTQFVQRYNNSKIELEQYHLLGICQLLLNARAGLSPELTVTEKLPRSKAMDYLITDSILSVLESTTQSPQPSAPSPSLYPSLGTKSSSSSSASQSSSSSSSSCSSSSSSISVSLSSSPMITPGEEQSSTS